MADDDSNLGPRGRRVVMRRSRGGSRFSNSGSDRLDGAPREHDEVDAAIDPEAVADRVRERATTHVPASEDTSAFPNPRSRLFEVAEAGSASYSREFRLNLLHRLLIRKIPLDQIARQLGVSISTVEKDRAALKKQLRERARELDVDEMIGGQTGVYDEVSAMALRIADGGQGENAVPTAMRLAAMRTALAANADKTRFYQSAGVFDVMRFRRAESGEAMSDVQMLMQRTSEMLQQLAQGDEPARKPRHGFKDFSLEDEDPEILDL